MKNLFIPYLLILFLSACGAGIPGPAFYTNSDDQFKVLAVDQGKDPVIFEVNENVATMSGVMDSTIVDLLEQLLDDNPQVDTILMSDVPGTIDFKATLKASYLVREHCLTTVIPNNGYVASGGVYFFLAGCERYVGKFSAIGIHTWRTYTLDEAQDKRVLVSGMELEKTDPAHDDYLDFHHDMDIDEEFYWLIVDTPFEDVHFLTSEEIEEYEIASFIDDETLAAL